MDISVKQLETCGHLCKVVGGRAPVVRMCTAISESPDEFFFTEESAYLGKVATVEGVQFRYRALTPWLKLPNIKQTIGLRGSNY